MIRTHGVDAAAALTRRLLVRALVIIWGGVEGVVRKQPSILAHFPSALTVIDGV